MCRSVRNITVDIEESWRVCIMKDRISFFNAFDLLGGHIVTFTMQSLSACPPVLFIKSVRHGKL